MEGTVSVDTDSRILRTMRLLWGIMSLTPLIFGFVLWNVIRQLSLSDLSNSDLSQTPRDILFQGSGVIFLVVAFVCLVASRVLPSLLFPSPEGVVLPVRTRMIRFIIGMCLLEAVASVGFVLGFLNYNLQVYLVFGLVAFLNMVIRFPRDEKVI